MQNQKYIYIVYKNKLIKIHWHTNTTNKHTQIEQIKTIKNTRIEKIQRIKYMYTKIKQTEIHELKKYYK